jgi:hypothetical protein
VPWLGTVCAYEIASGELPANDVFRRRREEESEEILVS